MQTSTFRLVAGDASGEGGRLLDPEELLGTIGGESKVVADPQRLS